MITFSNYGIWTPLQRTESLAWSYPIPYLVVKRPPQIENYTEGPACGQETHTHTHTHEADLSKKSEGAWLQLNFCNSSNKQTVHSPLFFRKIIEIKRFALWAAILYECQNYLGGGVGLGGSEKNRGTVITSLQLAFRRRERSFTPFTINQLRNSAGDQKHARHIQHPL